VPPFRARLTAIQRIGIMKYSIHLTALCALFALCFSTAGIQAAERSMSVNIPAGAGTETYDFALDQVYVPGRGLKEVGQQANLDSLEELARSIFMTAKETVFLVLYREGAPRTDENRALLTDEVVIESNVSGAAAASQTQGVHNVRALNGAPGFYKVTVIDSSKTLSVAERLKQTPGVKFSQAQFARQQYPRATPDDTLFPLQWHLLNTGQNSGLPGLDLNVSTVWDSIRGRNQTIAIIDDGLQGTHEDLTTNFQSSLSFDFNDNDPDPSPGPGDFHGTACAGVAAARGFNALGVSGVAPEAKLSGIRLIAAPTTDAQEAEAMGFQNSSIEIKSNSWGPADGAGYTNMGAATRAALAEAVTNGRSGRGTVFLWAGGNGGQSGDNSNYDGYSNSIFVIAVAAVGNDGVQSFYSEPGANLMVCAPSSSTGYGITTTDIMGADGYNSSEGTTGEPANTNYTSTFGGTSSACPAVAGVVALMLEANPLLSWRSIQNILIRTARQNDPLEPGWITNRAEIHFNHKYGAGLVDAGAAVAASTSAPILQSVLLTEVSASGLPLNVPDADLTGVTLSIPVSSTAIRSIEKVVVEFTMPHTYRGDLAVTLTSPTGTVSQLALSSNGDSGNNFVAWPFMTVRNWGERPFGTWTLKVADEVGIDVGTITEVNLKIYGTVASSSLSGGGGTGPSDGVVVVTSHPVTTVRISPSQVTLLGTADFPNVDVARVEYQHSAFGSSGPNNDGPPAQTPGLPFDRPWVTAAGTNFWSITKSLERGLHTFKIRAVAPNGTKSPGQNIKFLVRD